eukprot:COSAG01_NODE_69054_length_262_cov_0.950920_1_plen_23_part_10
MMPPPEVPTAEGVPYLRDCMIVI